jgi:hypothetical protein
LGKTKVAKKSTVTKKVTTTTKSHKKTTTRTTTTINTINTTAKTFPCACSEDCSFNAAEIDLRMVLGRPEFDENPTVQCACKIHYKCAKRWASAHHELPSVMPCGHPITKRGEDFWAGAVVGRRAEIEKNKQEEKKKQEEEEKQAEQKKRDELWAEFDSGSDLTDLED